MNHKDIFIGAHWIGKEVKLRKLNRKSDRNIMHFVKAPIRRAIDKSFSLVGYENRNGHEAYYFSKSIHVQKAKKAEVNITGLGYFELYINGVKVGNDILSPPYSQYEERVYYHTYNIADYLRDGDNVIGVILGNGMYNVHFNNAWNYDVAQWRGLPKFILSGVIEGEEMTKLLSDESWRVSTGPIISNDIYGGETYDARLELKGWATTDMEVSRNEKAVICQTPTKGLVPLDIEPVRVIKEIEPVECWQLNDDTWIVDLGVNITGFAKLCAAAPRGTEVTMVYGEAIKDRELDMTGLYEHTSKEHHSEIQKDIYIFKGEGIENWHPRFTYHGFQYVQVKGLKHVDITTLTGMLVHNDITKIGDFSCSNGMFNKIYEAMNRSNTNNFQGIPTDCPHREKNGWTGDVNLSVEYNLMTYSVEHLFKKWMRDICDVQKHTGQIGAIAPAPGWGYNHISGPVWDSTFIIIPWHIYLNRGDVKLLEELYVPMANYLKWETDRTRNHIVTYGLGDWCSPNREPNKPKAPIALTSTAYHYETTRIMAEIAGVLGKHEDASKYEANRKKIYEAFNKKFIDQTTGFVKGDCQTSYAAVLFFKLADEAIRPNIVERLVEQVNEYKDHLDTGIIGTKFLLDALSDHGHDELAYKIVNQRDYPGWGLWMEMGATTLWENWSGEQSRNHRMFGSVCSWFFKHLAGMHIDENGPNGRHIVIKPAFIEDLEWVKGSTTTIFGEISVHWYREGSKVILEIKAPEEYEVVVYVEDSDVHVIHEHEYDVRTAQKPFEYSF